MKYLGFIITAILLDVVSVDSCGGSHDGNHYEPDYYLEVNPKTLQLIDQQGSGGVITVSSNSPWTTTTDCDWLRVSPASGKGKQEVTVTAKTANESTSSRTGTIKISGENNLEQLVSVTQIAKPSDDNQ